MATEQDIQSDMYAQDTMKKPIYWTLFNGDLKHLERVMDNVTSDITGNDYFWNIHSNIINENFDGDWEWEDAIEFWELADIERALQMYKEPSILESEDDARDLSIHLTDNILNHFENYIPKDYVNAMEELSEYGEFELPTTLVNPLRDTIEKPHIKIWFDDEKGNRGSFYSWELQDLITELVMKRFNIEKEE